MAAARTTGILLPLNCSRSAANLALHCLALVWLTLHSSAAHAVPAFARQTHQPCVACHIGAFGPQLTPFGRQFKLQGYTLEAGDDRKIPLSMMLVETFTHTQKAQAESPGGGFNRNDNVELEQASAFLAGRISDHLGIFAQATYSENGGKVGWDNVELRYARSNQIGSHAVVWGISLNNNPGVSDVYNTIPAWQYPYMSPDLAPSVPATPVLFGAMAGQVIGASAYAQLDDAWYAEAGGYRSLSPAFLRTVNMDFSGRVTGVAPYARIAYTRNVSNGNFEIGGVVLKMRRGLVGTNTAGDSESLPGPADRFEDIGVDASYQYIGSGDHIVTVKALYVYEQERLDASFAAGSAERLHGTLRSLNLDASYWYKNTWGVTLGGFANNGSRDALLYPVTGRPTTNGGIAEFNWNPFGKTDSWAKPFANLRLGVQYTFYTRFAGAVRSIDGNDRRASDNNTLFVYAWTAL